MIRHEKKERNSCKFEVIIDLCEHIKVEWHIYAPLNKAIIVSYNGLLAAPHPAKIWTNANCQLDPKGYISMEIYLKINSFVSTKLITKCHPQIDDHFVLASFVKVFHVEYIPGIKNTV